MLSETVPACHPFWIGVDVGKESLSIYIAASNKALTIPNKTSAIKDFLRQYPAAALVLEATGGYETKIITLAIDAGRSVYRVNARRVRAFMESLGIYAKTDAIDAKALADFAAANVARLQPFLLPAPELKKLRQLARRREELISMRVQETNRLKAPRQRLPASRHQGGREVPGEPDRGNRAADRRDNGELGSAARKNRRVDGRQRRRTGDGGESAGSDAGTGATGR
jgi:transposase